MVFNNIKTCCLCNYRVYSIIESSHLSGLSIKRVRRYADADLLPEVERVIHGDRVYRHFTELDLSMLKLIKKYRGQGYYLKPAVTLARKDMGVSENKGVSDIFDPNLYTYLCQKIYPFQLNVESLIKGSQILWSVQPQCVRGG